MDILKKILRPNYLMAFTITYLASVWLLSYLIDVRNIFNLQRLYEGENMQLFWYDVFKERGLTEILQWCFLALGLFISAYACGYYKAKESKYTARFFMLMGLGLFFMYLEDAGNIRHFLRKIPMTLFNSYISGIVVELILYALLGFLMVYAILGHWRFIWHCKQAVILLAVGFIAYGYASVASATRNIGNWYYHVGNWINDRIDGGSMIDRFGNDYYGRPIGFFIMDFLIEESFELLGATALAGGLLALLLFIKKNPHLIDEPYQGKMFDIFKKSKN